MKEEIAKIWMEALKGDKYIQGRMYLRTTASRSIFAPARHCVMGVLCDLYQRNNPSDQLVATVDERIKGLFVTNYDGCISDTLPPKVIAWAGLSTGDGSYISSYNRRLSLSRLNDGGTGFDNLAASIERNWRDM